MFYFIDHLYYQFQVKSNIYTYMETKVQNNIINRVFINKHLYVIINIVDSIHLSNETSKLTNSLFNLFVYMWLWLVVSLLVLFLSIVIILHLYTVYHIYIHNYSYILHENSFLIYLCINLFNTCYEYQIYCFLYSQITNTFSVICLPEKNFIFDFILLFPIKQIFK